MSYIKTRGGYFGGPAVPAAGGTMTGALGIGATSPGPYLYVRGSSDSTSYIRVDSSTASVQAIYGANETEGFGGTLSNHSFTFRTNNTARFTVDTNSSAGNTALLVSIAGAAVQRVSVGANDSGGAGYRLLRVAN